MSTIKDDDLFLVQRGQNSHKLRAKDLMSTIDDKDYMLIQRGQNSHKVTCKDVKDQLGGGGGVTAPVLDSVVLSQDGSPDGNRFTSKSFTSTTTNSGGDAATLEMTGTVTGALGLAAGSDPITTNAYPGTSSTSVVLTLEGEENLGDVIQEGDTVTANVSYTPETDTIESVDTTVIYPRASYFVFEIPSNANWFADNATMSCRVTNSSGITWRLDNPNEASRGDLKGYSDIGRFGDLKGHKLIISRTGSNPLSLYGFYSGTTTNSLVDVTEGGTGDFIGLVKPPTAVNSSTPLSRAFDGDFTSDTGSAQFDYVPEKVEEKLTLPTEKDIELFQVDDIVQGTDVKVTATDVSAKTITVSGGTWTASTDKVSTTSAKQGSGTVSDITDAQVTVSPFTDNCFKEGQWLTVNKTTNVNPKTDKITSYVNATKVITVDGQTDLAQFADGDSVFMTDNSGSGASTKTGYKLTTTDIQTVYSTPAAQWSSKMAFENTYTLTTGSAASLFDGNANTQVDTTAVNKQDVIWTWDISSFNIVASTLSVFTNHSIKVTTDNKEYTFNGTSLIQEEKCDFDGAERIQKVEGICNTSGWGLNIQKFTINGIEVVDNTSLFTELTFPGAASTNPDLKYFKPNDIIQSTDVKVLSVDTARNKMTVDGGTWAQGDKVEYQTTGGVGTIATSGVNFTNKTITLTAGNSGDARWIDTNKAGTEFRVATAQKAAVATTAYLQFSADGAVTGYQATPVDPRAMDNKSNPKLTFPATFSDTGQAPDTEFPGTQTYIQTSVQLKNTEGNSATVASNNLVPQTTIRSIGPGEVQNNADDVKAMGMQVATHDQRVADHTAAKRQEKADELVANLRRYSS